MANSHGGSKCNSDTSKANNAYETKFQDMQKYIPFLEKMIQRLQRAKGGTRENQLAKMKSLYTILNDGKHRLTLESLEKCDSILRNLYQKVQGEEGDIMQQSLSPKNSDGKPVLPTTTATKAKENEPNPTWVFGSPKKPASGFKKNFKKQRLANVKAPGHARLHQSTASQSNPSAAKPRECPHQEPSKHKVTKLSSKISDLKSGKIKTNVMKHGSKVSSPPSVITSPPKEDSSVSDHNKSTVNQPKELSAINADQKKSIGNSSLTQDSAIGSNQDRSVAISPLTPHSSMNWDKKNEAVSSSITDHSTKNSKQIGNTAVAQHSASNLEKKMVVRSSLKQQSTSNLNENKRLIHSPVTPTSMLNAGQEKPIPGSSITQHSAPKLDVDKKVVSQMKLDDAKNLGQDLRNVSSTTIRHPHISSDNCPPKSNSANGVCDRLQSSSPTLLSSKRPEPNGSFNVSLQKMLPTSSSTFKSSDTITKPSTTFINISHSSPIESDELSIKKSTPTVLSENKPEKRDDVTNSNSPVTRCASTSNTFKTSETVTITKPSMTLINASHSPPIKSDELSIKESTPTVSSEDKPEKRDDVTDSPVIRCASASKTFKASDTITITKPSTTLINASHSPPIKSDEPSIKKSTPTVSSEDKPVKRDDVPDSSVTSCDELPQKRPVPLPSPKDPRLARGLLTKNVFRERWKNPTNPLQECKTELRQDNVSCKTETKQENVTGKTELSQNKSLRAKLAEQITTVHKVGTSVGGALRRTKNMSSIEQNRIANLKPGTIIDLMDKELPKTNKKLKQDKLSNQISDHQSVKTNQSTNTTHKSTLSNLSQEELEKLVVKNIHNLPALPPGTMQMLERISTNSSQGRPINYPGSLCNPAISDQVTNRSDSSQTSRSSDLHNKSEGSLSNSVISEEVSNRFDTSQNSRTSEFCNRVEGKLSNSVNSNQTSNRFDSSQTSRPTELYDRAGRISSNSSISDRASNRFDSCQNSRTSEFYNRVEGSNSVIDDQASNRFDPYQNSRSNEFYNRVESPAGDYSNWDNHALDSVGMSSSFRIQSPNYTQTNIAHDTSCGNNIYNRNIGLSSPYDPSICDQSPNDDSPLYGTNYFGDPRRRSLEQADCRSPDAEDWQRVVVREERSRFAPDYFQSSDSVWSEDNSRLPSRYHKANMGQNSTQYGRTLMTCRSNSIPSSGRRLADNRFSPERIPGRFSNSRSSLDYPEDRRYSDSRPAPERRVSEARLKRYRDYNEPFPNRSSLDHERVHLSSRSSHDRCFNTSSADRYNSYSDRSGLSQERDSRYSDSRMASSRRDTRDTDSYRNNNRRDTFSSPLDQLYSETRGPVTGRGYGVQNFRFPRFKPKENDYTSKRKPFDKNASKSIESEDASKSTELKAQTIPKEIENEDDSKSIEKLPPSNVSSFEKSSSNEISHSREESTLSKGREIENQEITKKSLECSVTDEIPITASNFVEERKVVILLEKSDMESFKEQGKNIISSEDSFDREILEVDGSEAQLKLEIMPDNSRLLEGSDDSSNHNSNTETEGRKPVSKHSDSIPTTPETLGDEPNESNLSFQRSDKETILITSGASENQSKEDITTACNVNSETTIPMSALTESDNISTSTRKCESIANEKAEISREDKEKEPIPDNISMSSTKKSESIANEIAEISHDEKEKEEENKNKEMFDNEKDTSSTVKPNSDDQKSKEELPTMNSTCLVNVNSDQSLESNNLEKNNDNSLEVDLSNESEIPLKNESLNNIQHCKIEEPCIKEDKESSNSVCGQSNKPISDFEDQKCKVLHEIVEVLMKSSQTEEDKRLIAKIKCNPEKLRKIQQILELSSDEEDNTDSKNVGSGVQEDIKPVISVGTGLENDETTEINKNEYSETPSNKSNDESSNDNSKDLKSTTNQLIETNKKAKQCDANRKKISPAKRTRNPRSRSNKKLEIPENVETSQEIEKGKRKLKRSELDKLHDGLREMFLKVEIEKSSGIRSCRLRNANITAPNKVDKSPEASNRKKLPKDKGSTKDEMDDSGQNLEDSGETKYTLEHENDKLEGNAQVEVKDSIKDSKAIKGNEQNTTKSSSSSNEENKEEGDDHSKWPSVSKLIDQKDNLQNNHDKQKADDYLIKSLMMSNSSFRSTPIVLLQKSNALISNKIFPCLHSSTSKPVAESVDNESEYHEQDKLMQQPCPTAVYCEKVDDTHAPEKAIETNCPSAPKKPEKVMKKKDFQEDLDNNQSVNIEKPETNPVILLEKRGLVEPVCQTATEMDVSSDNDNLSTDPGIQSDTSKNDTPIEVSSSNVDMGEIACRKRLPPEYSELPNIFTDKTYFQKDSALKCLKQFDCKICNFFGKSIVKHYVTEHSDQDVLISRLEANDAKEAIMKSKNEEINIKPSVFKCYMCCRTCTNLGSFYDHITSHTGEYRYRCQFCPFKVANRDAIKSHCTSSHSLDWKTNSKTAIAVDPIPDFKNVFGFICSDCYFVQLKQSTVEEHVKNHHSDASGVKVIRINMSSLDARPALATDKKDSNVPESIPKNHDFVFDGDVNENSLRNAIEDNDADDSNGTVRESRDIILNVCAFSCIEPMNDLSEKRFIMKETLQNIEETLFSKEQTVCETISGKIGKMSDSWKSSPGNERILSEAENISQGEAESNIQFPPEKVSESHDLANRSSAAEEEVTEIINIEDDRLNQIDETTILEEIKLATCDFEDGDNQSVGFKECPDDSDKSSKINCLLDRWRRKHEDSEENENCVYDRDDEHEEVRDDEIDLLDLVSKAGIDSAVVSKIDVGPLTISRSKDSVTFSCNISSCNFASDNPKYIVCHFGNHLNSSSKLNCSCCNEEFDCSLDTVGLMKGIVKHGLEHVLPPTPTPPPPTPTTDADTQSRRGMIRVRRLSGDKLSSFVEENLDNIVAGPSFVREQPSTSNDSLGNLRIESVVSAANCDLATFKALTSLHDEPNRKRRREETTVQSVNVKVLTDFYKCMGEVCEFSSNDSSAFKDHLKNFHFRRRSGSWFKCAYCLVHESCMTALLKHINLYHSHSVVQCAHCFYRSVSKSNVIYHQNSLHVNKDIKMYLCKKMPPVASSYLPELVNVIPAFSCTFVLCQVRSYSWDAIQIHILSHRPSDRSCHVCRETFSLDEPNELFVHYLNHNFGHYQCKYCIHAENTAEEMRGHLCTFHPDLKPGAVMRAFEDEGDYLLFSSASFGALNMRIKKMKDIDFDDIEEPEGSVIDCTGMIDEPAIVQDGQENESSAFDEHLWAQAQMLFEPTSSPTESLHIETHQLQQTSEIPLPDLHTPQVQQSDNPQQIGGVRNLANSTLTFPLPEETGLGMIPTSVGNSSRAGSVFVPTTMQQEAIHASIETNPSVYKYEAAQKQPASTMETIEISSESEAENNEEVITVDSSSTSDIDNDNPSSVSTPLSKRLYDVISSESEEENLLAVDSFDDCSSTYSNIGNNASSSADSVSSQISSKSDVDPTNGESDTHMCFLCNQQFNNLRKAIDHVVEVHRVTNTKIVRMYDSNSSSVVKVVRSEIVICNTPTKSSLDLKTKFAMNEVELLPKRAILSSPIYCDHCEFSNVVVKNMKIHLQNHASGKEVSNTLLVNPVPCLEKNEKMFDKMVNLAGSSHSQPAKNLELPEFQPPKFVEQSLRFSCCVCNYMTLQDQMLVLHMKAFHEDTNYYLCPHCTNVIVPIDKIAHHLRMHDVRMYRCAYCTYHHYQRHLINKHLNEKHPERKPYVQIVRDPDPVDDGFKSTEECDDEFNSHTKSLKVWQCSFCDTYKNKEPHIKEHCKITHGIQERYKCCFCADASESEDSIRAHFKNEHLSNELQIVNVYDRVCIFSPMPEYSTSVDVGLPRRRERNLRDNIRGITFAEGLRLPTRRTDYGNQTWSHFRCPECRFSTKSKAELIQHMWMDYNHFVSITGPSRADEKGRARMDQWINLVIQQQEASMLEHQSKSGEADGGDSKDQDQRPSEDRTTRPKQLHSRKRSLTKGFSTSDSSDDAGDSKKPKKTRMSKPRFKCGYCIYHCFLIKSMEKHQEEKHPGRPGLVLPISEIQPPPSSPIQPKAESIYECQICGRLDHKNALLDHFHHTHPSTDVKISFFEGVVFKCNYCGNVDASYERLTVHSHNEHPKMPVDVITVEKSTQEQPVKSPDYLPGCIRSNTRYSCSSCKAIFNAQHACRLHIKKEHDSNASIMMVSDPLSVSSSSSSSSSSQIPVVATPSTATDKSISYPRSIAIKKTATVAAKNPIAKKSTSKVRHLDNTKDVKMYHSTVVLSDLRNAPKQ